MRGDFQRNAQRSTPNSPRDESVRLADIQRPIKQLERSFFSIGIAFFAFTALRFYTIFAFSINQIFA
jgi:hypothetical protein